MTYKGHIIDIVGTDIYVDCQHIVPKQEGKTFQQCAEEYIDLLDRKS